MASWTEDELLGLDCLGIIRCLYGEIASAGQRFTRRGRVSKWSVIGGYIAGYSRRWKPDVALRREAR